MPNFFEFIKRTGSLTAKARYMGRSETYQGRKIVYGDVYVLTLKVNPSKLSKLMTWLATGISPSHMIFVTIQNDREGWSVECPYTWQGLNEIWKPLVRMNSKSLPKHMNELPKP